MAFDSELGGHEASEYQYRMHKVSLSSEFDRFLVDIKAEMDSRMAQSLKAQEGVKAEIKEEVMGQLGVGQEEIAELKQRLAEERERRVKLDKQVFFLFCLCFEW